MKILKFVGFAFIALSMAACATVDETSQSTSDRIINQVQIVDIEEINSSTDPYTIQSLTVKDDILAIEVCYGGCSEHGWKLMTTKRYKKSMPPQLDLHLVHDQHDDLCKRQDCSTLYFNVSDLKYPGKSENYTVTLNLYKSNKSVNYDY